MRIKTADEAPKTSPRKTSLKRLRTDSEEEEDNAGEESDIASLRSSCRLYLNSDKRPVWTNDFPHKFNLVITPTNSGKTAKRKRAVVNDNDVYQPESADGVYFMTVQDIFADTRAEIRKIAHIVIQNPSQAEFKQFSLKTPGSATSVSSRAPSSVVRTPTNKSAYFDR
ncbi:hypothetical protein SeMB42_g05144 [Synchytrium endobioticum]|nr:hypothetical protein SeLEV6574_g07903 [Synchytrium endobioticum]TPX42383.1 hypothetical protein SeMB42_g05144 [Synchytrium endobioticum]